MKELKERERVNRSEGKEGKCKRKLRREEEGALERVKERREK